MTDYLFDAQRFRNDQFDLLRHTMERCLQDLLEKKLLYQNCSVATPKMSPEKHKEQAQIEAIEEFERTSISCSIKNESVIAGSRCLPTQIFVPKTICTDCETCKGEITPHNPILVLSTNLPQKETNDQTFSLSYQCQKCKKGLLVFLVRRKGLKWQLVGRNQVSSPLIPASFPKAHETFFKEAEMAFRTGSHLASICLLRVAIEQYMRAETRQSATCSGDQLWEQYKKRLPNDFPLDRVCSLGEIYGRLSEVMHCPSLMQDDTFADCKEKLDDFFKFVALFHLVGESDPQKDNRPN